jgi:hypothetical protein
MEKPSKVSMRVAACDDRRPPCAVLDNAAPAGDGRGQPAHVGSRNEIFNDSLIVEYRKARFFHVMAQRIDAKIR